MKTALAAVLAAGVASACCIGPVAFVLLGGGIATATATRVHATQAKPAEATKVCTMKVTGMTCSGCEAAVKLAASRLMA